VIATNDTLDQLLNSLPERRSAERLIDQIALHASTRSLLDRNAALLSDVLTLAAWSPLLATAIENNPEYIFWLQGERENARVRTREELDESLARFALINSQIDPHVMLSRFRRRELLRTYLHDIRRTRTIVETTEELSNLADAILFYALKVARQELDNRYGAPQTTDAHGRISSAEFCVIALGKLGSSELNYASDIDLIFLFSDDGMTAPGGLRGRITNREYFIKLSEGLLRIVSEPTGEGASYRIDVRLRPHGREGTLAASIDEAVKYYKGPAQDWELQTLIRSRAAAGSSSLYLAFANRVTDRIFRKDISVASALANVRLSKEKIDRQRERAEKGFNVKLGRGGIREIEFIAQALQVAFGGRDPWLRSPHTLVSLGRLADRGLITEREHWQLSDAYHFLRALEHRLQMEHGLQTHSLPADRSRRELVARRMNYFGENSVAEFDSALSAHTDHVHGAFDRIFGKEANAREHRLPSPRTATVDDTRTTSSDVSLQFAAKVFSKHADWLEGSPAAADEMAQLLRAQIAGSLNAPRATALITRIAASLDKESEPLAFGRDEIHLLVQLCGVSEYFGEMIATRLSLIHSLARDDQAVSESDLHELIRCVTGEKSFGAELDALRRLWSKLFMRIGARDSQGGLSLSETNRVLNQLAVASLDASLLIAQRELCRRYKDSGESPRVAALGLGRLASGGMDYGSDLDVIIVYDSSKPPPIVGVTHEEAYARLVDLLITTLSSITREGHLYRVDLRLRPDGQKGALAAGSQTFLSYVEKRADVWEWLAYVKLCAVAGDTEFGQAIEAAARASIHELARQIDPNDLRNEARRVRERLEKEKASRRGGGLNIKHGAGGMLDVYFTTRYLQLRDNVPDDGEDRTTLHTIRRLRDAGSLTETDFAALHEGYKLLRAVDHQSRLIVGRSAVLPSPEQSAFEDISVRLEFGSSNELSNNLEARMSEIRDSYNRIMLSESHDE
jgi:glutamate-ammonia-ligase adenylyltransferase